MEEIIRFTLERFSDLKPKNHGVAVSNVKMNMEGWKRLRSEGRFPNPPPEIQPESSREAELDKELVKVVKEWTNATDEGAETTCITCGQHDGNHDLGNCEFWRMKYAIKEHDEALKALSGKERTP